MIKSLPLNEDSNFLNYNLFLKEIGNTISYSFQVPSVFLLNNIKKNTDIKVLICNKFNKFILLDI